MTTEVSSIYNIVTNKTTSYYWKKGQIILR